MKFPTRIELYIDVEADTEEEANAVRAGLAEDARLSIAADRAVARQFRRRELKPSADEAQRMVSVGDIWMQNAWPRPGRLVEVSGVSDGRVYLGGDGDLDAKWFVGRFSKAGGPQSFTWMRTKGATPCPR